MAGPARTGGQSRELAALVADARAFHGEHGPTALGGSGPGPGPAPGAAPSPLLAWWARHRLAQWLDLPGGAPGRRGP
ncbi:hypothetical protein ACFW1A_33060 [Kitasatospora sp. NPDC058965]|uniref:hypothetical protein n=1 Tax=Kitasatospora sp. NPDC058965 TaxID=3346682 RepID=UPI0036A72291